VQQAPWDADHDYTMDAIEVYFQADQTAPLDPADAPKRKSTKKYVKLDLKQTLLSALQHENHMIPQFPLLKIISSDNDFKESFLNEI